MDIYSILSSKPHNISYLNRYLRYLDLVSKRNSVIIPTITEKHHICPKANDMFPQYKSFKKHPWNMICLTPKQHLYAHFLLWKIYRNKSTNAAFFMMSGYKHHGRLNIKESVLNEAKIQYKKDRSEQLTANNPMKKIRTNTGSFKKGILTEAHIWNDERKSKISKHMKENNIQKIKVCCLNCQDEIALGSFYAHHQESCPDSVSTRKRRKKRIKERNQSSSSSLK